MIIDLTDKIEIKERWEDEKKVIDLLCKEPLILTSYKIKGFYNFYSYYENDYVSQSIECNIKFTNDETIYQFDWFQGNKGFNPLDESFQLKNTQEREIKYINLKYDPIVTSSFHDGRVATQKEIHLEDVKIFGKIIDIDSGLRVKGSDNRIYTILENQNNSPLKINTNTGIKNIKLIPIDNSANSKLRIKTKNGIMAIAIKES